MAKKIEIDIIVNGKMQKATVEASKLKNALDGTAKSAHTADRNIKGASEQSANGTKNFSKMAQGVGGLVAVYATLAATAFAVSAAFEFFKRVGDLRVLQDSQVAYASSTGTALKTLSNDIREAADGMLQFQEASQSAAIGVASGLTPDQLTDLARGASAVSKILGRDVSDSFDRLVRGVTKAEPELLDELGITLRLEDAKKKYAASIGKTAQSLSLLEQKQAVAAEVQDQLETKFISTSEAIETQDNAVKKLGVAFNDVFNTVSTFLSGPIEGIASFLSEHMASLIAVIALFATSVIRNMMPSLDSFVEKTQAAADKASDALKEAKDDLQELKGANDPSSTVSAALKNVKTKPGSGIDRLRNQQDLTKRQAATLLRYAKQEKGVYNQLTMYQKQQYKKALRDILGEKDRFWSKAKRGWYGLSNHVGIQAKRLSVTWKQTMATITSVTTKATTAISRGFMGAFKILTGLLIGAQLLISVIRKFMPGQEDFLRPPKNIRDFSEQVTQLENSLKTMKTEFGKTAEAIAGHLEKMNEGITKPEERVKQTITSLKTLTNFASNVLPKLSEFLDIDANQPDFATGTLAQLMGYSTDTSDAAVSAADIAQEFLDTFKQFESINISQVQAVVTYISELEDISKGATLDDYRARLKRLGDEFSEQYKNIVAFEESFKASNTAMDSLIAGLSKYKTKATDLLNTTIKEIEATAFATDNLGNLIETTAEYKEQERVLKERLTILLLINETETGTAADKLKAEFEFHRATVLGTNLLTARAKAEQNISNLKADVNNRMAELALINAGDLVVSAERKEFLLQQLGLMDLQLERLIEQEKYSTRLANAGFQGLESGLQTNIYDLLVGEETSFTDALAKVAKSVAESIAKELADQATEQLMKGVRSFLNIEEEKTPAELMEESMIRAGELVAGKWESAIVTAGGKYEEIRARGGRSMGAKGGIDTTDNSAVEVTEQDIAEMDRLKRVLQEIEFKTKIDEPLEVKIVDDIRTKTGTNDKKDPPILDVDGKVISDEQNKVPKKKNGPTELDLNFEEGVDSQNKNTGSLNINTGVTEKLTGVMDGLGGTFTNGVTRLLTGLAGGSGGKGLLQTVVSSVISAYAPGAGTAVGRYGGVFSGGKAVGYATGGIAKGPQAGYPAVLHGTEAVVPLPNNKSIPVDLQGAGQQNNVVVNVSVDSSGGSGMEAQGDSTDSKKLGTLIAGAVQKELHNQKRAGGILNPMGAS